MLMTAVVPGDGRTFWFCLWASLLCWMNTWGSQDINVVGQLQVPHSDVYGLSESTQFFGEWGVIDLYDWRWHLLL